MSLSVFLLSCAMLFLSFFAARALPALFNNERLMRPLTFFGQNSLLYLYVNFPIILLLKRLRIIHHVKFIDAHPYLMWVLAIALTYLVMFILLPFEKIKWLDWLFDQIPTWVVMIALVFGVGLYIRNQNLVYVLEVFLGLVTSLFYTRLAGRLKERIPASKPVGAPAV